MASRQDYITDAHSGRKIDYLPIKVWIRNSTTKHIPKWILISNAFDLGSNQSESATNEKFRRPKKRRCNKAALNPIPAC